jgi:hypothetical protein
MMKDLMAFYLSLKMRKNEQMKEKKKDIVMFVHGVNEAQKGGDRFLHDVMVEGA